MGWWLGLAPATLEFGVRFPKPNERNQGKQVATLCTNKQHSLLKYRVPHGSHEWAPDLLMVGIRSPDGLVVGSCTSHPGVLGLIPKQEEPGKPGRHPVSKYRVPHGSHSPSPHANSFIKGTAVINTHMSSIDMYNNDVGKKFMK